MCTQGYSVNESNLRMKALEISLKYGDVLFPTLEKTKPSIVVNNAHKIMKLVTEGWNEPIIDPPATSSW